MRNCVFVSKGINWPNHPRNTIYILYSIHTECAHRDRERKLPLSYYLRHVFVRLFIHVHMSSFRRARKTLLKPCFSPYIQLVNHTHAQHIYKQNIHSLTPIYIVYKHTVYVEARRVRHLASPILSPARVLASILHHHMTNIDVANNVTVYRYVLSNHESAKKS